MFARGGKSLPAWDHLETTTQRKRKAKERSGGMGEGTQCLSEVTLLPSKWSLGQRALSDNLESYLYLQVLSYFISSSLSRCWVRFHGLCKAERIYIAKNLLIRAVLKNIYIWMYKNWIWCQWAFELTDPRLVWRSKQHGGHIKRPPLPHLHNEFSQVSRVSRCHCWLKNTLWEPLI